ncbi:MAG TPA: hypothetical protein VFA70_11615, partial [Dehalococcoidia bacterium]|nr:hypothetical protein [Dehalococcoidia bacterium]
LNAQLASPAPPAPRTLWWRLKIAAVVALILANMLYFGGNAALDLWQVAGPGTHFNGTIIDHKHIVTQGEETDEYFELVIQSQRGALSIDVGDAIYNSTDNGQRVSGTLDSRGLLGHDEALRQLSVDGRPVFDANVENRILGQSFILLVVAGVGGLALYWMWRNIRRPAGAHAATVMDSR